MVGARVAGWLLLVGVGAGIAAVTMEISRSDRTRILTVLTDPSLLLLLVIINGVLGLVRALAATDAWRRAGGKAFGVGVVLLGLFTLMPHVAVAYLGLETRTAIMRVFPLASPIAVEATSTTQATTTTLASTTVTEPGSSISSPPIRVIPPEPPTTSTSSTTTLPLGTERLTVLLLGTDAGPGRPGRRTDSMIVATVDTRTGESALFSLPRNMAGFRFSDGTEFPGLGRGILNEVYLWAQSQPERWGGPYPGINALMDVAETLLGIPIDHYVMVDMIGFAELVDTLGGVTVNNPKAFEAPLYDKVTGGYEMVSFQPGVQHLDGDYALAYSRSRTSSNDYVRMGRQRCVLSGLVSQTSPLTSIARIPALLGVMENYVTTDIAYNELPYLINFAPNVDREHMAVIGFDVSYRSGEVTDNGLPKPDVPKIQSVVAQVIAGGWTGSEANLRSASDACG